MEIKCCYCFEPIKLSEITNKNQYIYETDDILCINCSKKLRVYYKYNSPEFVTKYSPYVFDQLQISCICCNKGILIPILDIKDTDKIFNLDCPWCALTNDIHINIDSGKLRINYSVNLINLFNCRPGVIGCTELIIRKIENVYVARMGVSIMGSTNFAASNGANPFDINFRDNYAEGRGETIEESTKNLNKEIDSIRDSLFA